MDFGPGEAIVTQGEPGDALYFVESGTAQAFKDEVELPDARYGHGDWFGELGLLNAEPRLATVVRVRACAAVPQVSFACMRLALRE